LRLKKINGFLSRRHAPTLLTIVFCQVINFDLSFPSHFFISCTVDAFDVYNIETALPVIDLEAIESHLMASAKEEEKKVSHLL